MGTAPFFVDGVDVCLGALQLGSLPLYRSESAACEVDTVEHTVLHDLCGLCDCMGGHWSTEHANTNYDRPTVSCRNRVHCSCLPCAERLPGALGEPDAGGGRGRHEYTAPPGRGIWFANWGFTFERKLRAPGYNRFIWYGRASRRAEYR